MAQNTFLSEAEKLTDYLYINSNFRTEVKMKLYHLIKTESNINAYRKSS
jgi:hypothetical protein